MNSPVFIPLAMSAVMCMVCAFAGGGSPQTFFQEWQPASIYNALQLFFCAFVAGAIVVTCRDAKAQAFSSALFWSIVSAACAYLGLDELFQWHGNFGPIAQSLSEFMGQPGKRSVLAGFELASWAFFAFAVGLCFRREIFSLRSSMWIFALAALLLGGSRLIDYAFLPGAAGLSDGALTALAQSLKLAGFAAMLGALMETLLQKRQRLSVEKMLSQLAESRSGEVSQTIRA